MDEPQVLEAMQQAIDRDGNQHIFARRIGISHAHVNLMLHGKRGLSPKLLAALGLRRIVTYVKEKRSK